MTRGSLLLLALALAPRAASAQAPSAAADAAYEEGRRLYDLQEWDRAIDRFKEAYRLHADARALFNIAQAYRLKGDCASAAGFYKTFKRNYPRERDVDKFITQMEACAAAAPKPDPVKPVEPPPAVVKPAIVEPRPTEPRPTEPRPTEPVTPAPVKPGLTTPAPSANLTTTARPTGSPGSGQRIAGLAIAGTGAALVGVGAVFGVMASGAARDAERAAIGTTWDPENRGPRAPVPAQRADRARGWRCGADRRHRALRARPWPRARATRGGPGAGRRRRDPRLDGRLLMRALRIYLVGVTMAACYEPSVDSCRYACFGANRTCPDGLSCNLDNRCAPSGVDRCATIIDDGGPGDGGLTDATTVACGWRPSNVNPCAIGAATTTADLELKAGTIIQTGPLAITGPMPPLPPFGFEIHGQIGGVAEATVLFARNIMITGPITVRGPRPLIILANGNVTINAAVTFEPFGLGTPDPCPTSLDGGDSSVLVNATGAAGGGGGGFGPQLNVPTSSGAPGGNGGQGSGGESVVVVGGLGGPPVGMADLRPIRFGCRGGHGGINTGNEHAAGGGAGGAIRISARGDLHLDAPVSANGGGGRAGLLDGGGGGGGGAGGAVLLEASGTVTSQQALLVCANGGGGGGGRGSGATTPGGDGRCDGVAAAGGGISGTPGAGGAGNGSGMDPQAGLGGGSGSGSSGGGGGGGGGGPGRIRFNGNFSGTIGIPPPTVGPAPQAN